MIRHAVSLVMNCAVSFRSVPKILEQAEYSSNVFDSVKIPHFTTAIRWVTRLGHYLLKRSTKKFCSPHKPWICVADHTIQVGTNKAFVVIGIPAKKLESGNALELKDATVLTTAVKKSWTGEAVAFELKKVFKHNGYPLQIVIDGASNLKKGVREALEGQNCNCHVTYDITHLIANLFKQKYDGGMGFQGIIKKLATVSKQITQTDIGYLLPPKLREKSRFLNLPNLANWFDKLINIRKQAPLTHAEKRQIKKYFGWVWKPKAEAYIRTFIKEVKAIKDLQKILKNTGINEYSCQKAYSKLAEIDDEAFTKPIRDAILADYKHSKDVGYPLLMTSDLIESLFGKHKSITKPHRLSEINRSVLSVPVICEEITSDLIDKAFSKTTEKEVNRWTKRNIPSTLLSRKAAVMRNWKDNVINLEKTETKPKTKYQQANIGLELGVSFSR